MFIVTFLGQFCPREKGAMRLTLCEAPTLGTRPDHNTGNYVPYSFLLNMCNTEGAGEGAYSL